MKITKNPDGTYNIPEHEHSNGLYSCPECLILAATGKCQEEINQEIIKNLEKDLYGKSNT